MSFDDIPEDAKQSFPCPECDEGEITEKKEFPGFWECSCCYWEGRNLRLLGPASSTKMEDMT